MLTRPPLRFGCLGVGVKVEVAARRYRAALTTGFSGLAAGGHGSVRLRYCVESNRKGDWLLAEGAEPLPLRDPSELLFQIDRDLILTLQEARPELLFLHAAVLEFRGRAVLISGDSGAGKSTTAWALLQSGFGYLSDELAPVELERRQVHAYPRALGLKSPPPQPYRLPADALHGSHGFHVPNAALPGGTVQGPLAVAAVLFVNYRPERPAPALRPLGAAEGTLRLYRQTLNPLCHAGGGLGAVAGLGREWPCFEVDSAGLADTCQLLSRQLDELVGAQR